MQSLTNEELAYLAGIIDGEGTIAISVDKAGYYALRLLISNTSTKLIEWLSQRLEVSIYTSRQRKAGSKQLYSVDIVSKKGKEVIEQVFPYLIVKKDHARVAFLFPFLRDYPKEKWEELKVTQSFCYEELKELNKRGVKEDPLEV